MIAFLVVSASVSKNSTSCVSIQNLYRGEGLFDRPQSCCNKSSAEDTWAALQLSMSVDTFCEQRSPTDLESLVASFYRRFYKANTKDESVGVLLNTAADVTTMSYYNLGAYDLSREPRMAFDNHPYNISRHTPSSRHTQQFSLYYWESLYDILKDAKEVMMQIQDKSTVYPLLVAQTKFAQALSIGYLANTFDKVWIIKEGSHSSLDVWNHHVDYKQAMQTAISLLDEAIEICSQESLKEKKISYQTIEQHETYLGSAPHSPELTVSEYTSLMRSYGARMLAGNARSKAESSSADWTKIESYAAQGIEEDFMVSQDYVSWYNQFVLYSTYQNWGRIDLKVINMLNGEYPSTWPADTSTLPPVLTNDARLESDYEYLDSQGFRPDRGEYHYSSYRLKVQDKYYNDLIWLGDGSRFSVLPEVRVAEVQMYLAEAKLRKESLVEAMYIINNGTRVSRGKLPPVEADAAAIEAAIHHERLIEFPVLTPGISFYERRRTDTLQKGTPLHIPVPGSVLESLSIPVYTYGGSGEGDYGDLTGPHGEPGKDYATEPSYLPSLVYTPVTFCKCTDPEYPYCYDSGGDDPDWDGKCYKSATSFSSDTTCSYTDKCGPANQLHS